MPRARRIASTVGRALALAPVTLLVLTGTAWADVQLTPTFLNTPGSSDCTLHAPNVQCGSWTYWMAFGAIILGVLVLIGFVVAYFRFAPRFQVQEPVAALGGSGGGAARTLAAPPPAARPAAPAAEPAAAAGAAPAAATAVAVTEPEAAPPVAGEAPAAPAGLRPPSPRPDHVEPDQETYDRVLAEQLGKGTDRRIAEGRAKSAAIKAARDSAQG